MGILKSFVKFRRFECHKCNALHTVGDDISLVFFGIRTGRTCDHDTPNIWNTIRLNYNPKFVDKLRGRLFRPLRDYILRHLQLRSVGFEFKFDYNGVGIA